MTFEEWAGRTFGEEFKQDDLLTYCRMSAAWEIATNAEREACIAQCKKRMDYEAKAAAHHAGTWQSAHEYHMTRFAAMSDLIDVLRSN